MTKQLLFYEQVQPVNKSRHANWAIRDERGYDFAAATNMVPLAAAEFGAAAVDFPIVFVTLGETVLPAAVLGLEREKSYFVDGKGNWQGKYIPAYVRRYPFILSPTEDGGKFLLCLDEAYGGWDRDGQSGQRLFDDNGETTPYLNEMLEFLNTYQTEHARSRQLGELLRDHNLLMPVRANLPGGNGRRRSLRGFQAVSRDRLKKLEPAQITDWHANGILEAIYLHLWSLRNFQDLVAKQMAGAQADRDSAIN